MHPPYIYFTSLNPIDFITNTIINQYKLTKPVPVFQRSTMKFPMRFLLIFIITT